MEIYLAALKDKEPMILELEQEGIIVPYVLETYSALRGLKGDNFILDYVKRNNCKFLLDSGGFTFINSQQNASKKEIYEFLYDYIDFINENKIKRFFELDVDALLGYEEVQKMTKILENKTGRQSIPVFHYQTRTKEDFIQMVKEYDYVSIGSDSRRDEKIYRYYKWAIQTAHRNQSEIHGLGFTPLSNLNNQEFHFDTVDSTSWNSGGRFGAFYRFNGRELIQIKNESKYRIKVGDKDFNYNTLDKQNLIQWLRLIEYKAHHKN